MDKELKNCKKCGGEAKVRTSTGGFTIYFAVWCIECGFNTRGRGVMNGLLPLGSQYSQSDNAPQNSKEEAIKIWEEINK